MHRLGWQGAFWPAIFHSVSAFCNAGFSTFTDSVMGFQRSPFTLLVLMLLIVAGGLGFLTLEEIYLWFQARREHRGFRVSMHSRVVLLTTAILIVAPWPLFVLLERSLTLKGLPLWLKVVNGLFISVTPRTAGFNNIDYGQATDSTNFLTGILMFIGGSPGSTAGGLRTTTVAIIGLLAWSRFRGEGVAHLWGRTIPADTSQRAVGLAVAAFTLVTACIFLFTASEMSGIAHHHIQEGFLKYMFEAISAFNTVGLSMGVTSSLSVAGKWITILLMFLGRVGLPTVAAALTLVRPKTGGKFRYAYEDVVVG